MDLGKLPVYAVQRAISDMGKEQPVRGEPYHPGLFIHCHFRRIRLLTHEILWARMGPCTFPCHPILPRCPIPHPNCSITDRHWWIWATVGFDPCLHKRD